MLTGHLSDADRSPSFAGQTSREWGPPLFVWGAWAGLLLGQLAGVAGQAVNVPWWDDWFNVPFLTGHEPITLAWLWEQTPGTETRTPLYRLFFVALFKLGGDLRALMFFNVLALGALAFASVRVAARLRGRVSYADAFFPLLLLHWGHAEVLLWSSMIFITTPLALVGGLLLLVVQTRRRLTTAGVLLGGAALVLLSLCGSTGLVFLPFAGLWYAWAVPKRGRVAGLALLLAAAAGLLAVLFFLGDYERGPVAKQPWADRIEGAFHVLSMTLGMAGKAFVPRLGWLVAGGLLATMAWLLRGGWQVPARRTRALGLFLLAAAALTLAFLLGWKRPLSWCAILYYGTLPMLGLCVAYFAWGLFSSATVGTLAQMALFVLSGAMLSLNIHEGLVFAVYRTIDLKAVEKDIEDGVPASVLTEMYAGKLFWNPVETEGGVFHRKLYEGLQALHEAQAGAFADLADERPMTEIALPRFPDDVQRVFWDDGTATGDGKNSWIAFDLPEAPYVYGIRLRYRHSNSRRGSQFYRYSASGAQSYRDSPLPTPFFQVEWTPADQSDLTAAQRYVDLENTAGPEEDQTLTIWVHETIERLRILPDRKPFVCRIDEVVLLVPADPARKVRRPKTALPPPSASPERGGRP